MRRLDEAVAGRPVQESQQPVVEPGDVQNANRLPLQSISAQEEATMYSELEKIGFFEYCNK